MKKVLGLDLGVASIGWALVGEETEKRNILGMGSRIIPLSADDKNEFSSGNAISKNQARTRKRTQRRGYDRYQLRRKFLIDALKKNNMLPDEDLVKLDKLFLWKLRSNGVTEKLELKEIGRVLLHINQKRGYKSSRSDANLDKKDTEYVALVKSRYEALKQTGFTIGQYFFDELSKDEHFRIKEKIFPREAYIEEYNAIIKNQQKHYPGLFTDELTGKIKDEIIYYQRKLKSQKGLVSVCEYEGFWIKDKNGKDLFCGPKVAPKSSPLFQICRIWEMINNISLRFRNGDDFIVPADKKEELFEYLDNHETLTYAVLLKILGLKKEDVYGNKQLTKGLPGNKIKTDIIKCFNENTGYDGILKLKTNIEQTDKEVFLIDKKTGEVVKSKLFKIISAGIEKEPYYLLWHIVYSIPDKEECRKTLQTKFGITEEISEKLASLDLTKYGFGNKSHKAMRKILPYLMEGDNLYDAYSYAGYYNKMAVTKEESIARAKNDRLMPIAKNSLRQPIVEKILNQMVNLVNALIDKHGKPDEIRIELARELKQSRDERNDAYKAITKRERENKEIIERLSGYGLRGTRNNIIKWRLYHEINNEDKKQNAVCIYCGQPISLTAAINGLEVDIEHIIPQSRLFDDSQNNKTLSHRKCNADKGNLTAFDFMKAKAESEFNDYLERINILFKNGIISKGKRDRLLMPGDKIPDDFIERQLRQTQYITRKSREILQDICPNVWVTGGTVTSELRNIWGWNDVLMNLQLPEYREAGLTEVLEYETDGGVVKKEVIKNWSKRNDHRHHAIDALTIACTQQGFIQRFNHLNAGSTRNAMLKEIKDTSVEYDKKRSLLENYIYANKPFTTAEVENEAAKIIISIKPGKKTASTGTRKIIKAGKKTIIQKGIIIPRGALSEESVYGKIKTIEKEKTVKYLFENPQLIFKHYIKELVEARLLQCNNDSKEALKSLKKDPIYLDAEKTVELKYATCYREEVVLRKPVESLKDNQIEDIVDPEIKKIITDYISGHGGNAKEAFKNLENNPIWFNEEKRIPIRSVRWKSGLSAIEPCGKDDTGKTTGYVKPGNNHHIAFYLDKENNKRIHICSFWHAVERKKYGLPVIIKNPAEVMETVLKEPEDKFSESFLEKLPEYGWVYLESMQQNELFVLGISSEDITAILNKHELKMISKYLYRVQKLFYNGKELEIYFRHHLDTTVDDSEEARNIRRFYQIKSLTALETLQPKKIKIDILGELID